MHKLNYKLTEMSFPLDKLSHFLCWQYEQNHTKQLASSLAPALATIVVKLHFKYYAATYLFHGFIHARKFSVVFHDIAFHVKKILIIELDQSFFE